MEKAKEMIEKFKKALEDAGIDLPELPNFPTPSGVVSAPSAGTTGSLAARQVDNATVEEIVAKAQEWIKKLMEMLNQGSGLIPSASAAAPVATSA
jgi:predicted RNase H-like HicB family nuclease